MKKRMTLLLAIIMLLTVLPMNVFANGDRNYNASSSVSTRFADVPSTHWAHSAIMQLVGKGALSGYPDGTFKPNGLVTRSEFAVMMTRALDIPLVTNPSQTFVDVGRDAWDFVYVETAKAYLTGYKQGNDYYFKGKESAVREDMAVALVRAMGLENQQVDINELKTIFKDYNDISPNLQKYVLIAYKNDLISGYPDGTFGAQKFISRAEAAALLVRVLNSDAMEKVAFDTIVTTSAASSVRIDSATLNGSFTNNSGTVEYGFYWGTTNNPTTKVVTGTSSEASLDFTHNLSLTSNTTYYFKAFAGTSEGAVQSFSTDVVVSSTSAASNIKSNSATLNGSFGNNSGTVEYGFYWGTNWPETKVVLGTSSSPSLSFSYDLTNLTPNTTYNFMAYAGTSIPELGSFKTTAAGGIAASASAATAVKSNAATLNGSFADNLGTVEYGFYWGTTPRPTTKVVKGTSSEASLSFSYDLKGLKPDTEYFFRTYAGESESVARLFITSDAGAVTVSTSEAISLKSSSATLSGSLTNNSGGTVENGFYWGTTSNPTTKVSNGTSSAVRVVFTYGLSGLTPNTTYYFRAYAGTSMGEVMNFTTPDSSLRATSNSASCGTSTGTIWGSFNGNSETVEYGFYLGKTTNPTAKAIIGTSNVDSMNFSYEMTWLEPNTTYYFRAYAGTAQGDLMSFKTQPLERGTSIEVESLVAQGISSNSANVYAYFIGNKSGTPVEYGFYWGTGINSMTTKTVVGTTTSERMGFDNEFMLTLTGLKPNTTYYFKAYAGDSESIVRNFKTLSVPQTLELSQATWETRADGGAINVTVYSNTAWEVSSNVDWLTVRQSSSNGSGNGMLILTAEANTSGTPRNGRITVTSGSLSQTIKVTQAST